MNEDHSHKKTGSHFVRGIPPEKCREYMLLKIAREKQSFSSRLINFLANHTKQIWLILGWVLLVAFVARMQTFVQTALDHQIGAGWLPYIAATGFLAGWVSADALESAQTKRSKRIILWLTGALCASSLLVYLIAAALHDEMTREVASIVNTLMISSYAFRSSVIRKKPD